LYEQKVFTSLLLQINLPYSVTKGFVFNGFRLVSYKD